MSTIRTGKTKRNSKNIIKAKTINTSKSQNRHYGLLILMLLGICLFFNGKKVCAEELLDLDVLPEAYDSSVYTRALSTVFIETGDTNQVLELLFLTDHSDYRDITIVSDEETGLVTYTFSNTYNALGENEHSFDNKYLQEISIQSVGTDVVVTVYYNEQCQLYQDQDEDGILTVLKAPDYSLRLRLPEQAETMKITDVDDYYHHTFTLKFPGNWKDYYQEHSPMLNDSVIRFAKLAYDGNNTRLIVKTEKLQGYRYQVQDGWLKLTIDDPRKIYPNIVVLDAGHGGKDHGAKRRGVNEKDINLKIMYTLAKKYFNAPDSEVKAYWTRQDDRFISLSDRARFARQVGADLFVSLHMNAAYSSVNGMEVYYSYYNNRKNAMGITSWQLAKILKQQLKDNLSIPSRGVKQAGFYVMKHNSVPAILIELGFLSGNRDFGKLTSEEYQDKAAWMIYEGIAKAFRRYPTERSETN